MFRYAHIAKAIVLLAFLFILPLRASAGIRPSFYLEYSAWNATQIVIATEGRKIDGVFTVMESWKGSLKPGDEVRIPELASFKSEASRSVSGWWHDEEGTGDHVPFVTGERMVLFLKEVGPATQSKSGSRVSKARARSMWQPVTPYDDEWSVSVLWIERGEAYGFLQQINPGDSLLCRLYRSEYQVKNRALEVLDAQSALSQAVALADPVKRANALQPFVHNEFDQAREAAFDELVKCGDSAIPVLERMLDDDSLLDIHAETVEALAKIGGNSVAVKLTDLVEMDLIFWKQTAPILEEGWWNGAGFESLEKVEPLRDRYSRDYRALLTLKQMRYGGCEAEVTEFRDFWRSLPQLDDKSGLNQMTQVCDEILKQLQVDRN